LVTRCDAMRCDAMRCDAMRCDAMRCDAMRCDAMRCDATVTVWYCIRCAVEDQTQSALREYTAMCKFLAEDPKQEPTEVFGPLYGFLRDFEAVRNKVCAAAPFRRRSHSRCPHAHRHTHTHTLSCVSGCAHGVVRVSAQARERYAAAARDAPRKRSMKEGSATGLLKNQRSRSGDPVRWLWQRVAELCRLVSMCRVLAVLRGAECGGTRSLRALGVVAPPHSQCSVVGCVRSSGGLWRCKRRLHCASLVVLCRSEAAAPRRRRHGLWRQRLGADDPCGFCGGSCHV
jgi:hypothetical protein